MAVVRQSRVWTSVGMIGVLEGVREEGKLAPNAGKTGGSL